MGRFREGCRKWRSNPSEKCSHERLTRGTVTSTMRRAARPSGCARCGAGADCSAMKYQSLKERYRCLVRGPAEAGPEVVPESREVESEGEAGILDPLQPPRLSERVSGEYGGTSSIRNATP